MRALTRHRYGPPAVVEVSDLEGPEPGDDEVLVRVRAASVNPADWYSLTGWMYLFRASTGLFRPKDPRLGTDFSGTVESVGSDVTDFEPGDDVFGARTGALAEYITVRNAVVRMPVTASFEQAAALPTAGVTALQALRDHGAVQAGHQVLINGASGGVGTFAVQIAKTLGAEVTAVCSTDKVDLVRSLGADRVIDYTSDDFTRSGLAHDVVIDIAGTRSWRALKRVLKPGGKLVIVGAPKGGHLIGPLGKILRRRLASMFGSRSAVFFIARFNRPDLETLGEMLEAGTVTPVIDRIFPLAESDEAFRHLGEGHARGKVVLTI